MEKCGCIRYGYLDKKKIFIFGDNPHVFYWYNFKNLDDSLFVRTFFYCKDQDSVKAIVTVMGKLDGSELPYDLVVQYDDNTCIYKMKEAVEAKGK